MFIWLDSEDVVFLLLNFNLQIWLLDTIIFTHIETSRISIARSISQQLRLDNRACLRTHSAISLWCLVIKNNQSVKFRSSILVHSVSPCTVLSRVFRVVTRIDRHFSWYSVASKNRREKPCHFLFRFLLWLCIYASSIVTHPGSGYRSHISERLSPNVFCELRAETDHENVQRRRDTRMTRTDRKKEK